MNRREFLLAAASLALASRAGTAAAQETGQPAQSMSGPMDASGLKSVRLPPKPGATPVLDDEAVKQLELNLKCQCTCPQDVYTCRTTDVKCPVSPVMHRDVMALVDGGYSAEEITEAFVDVYGERARMAPRAEGFNIVAYVAPYAAVGGAAALVAAWITKNLRRQKEATVGSTISYSSNATPEELERIQRAMREGEK